MAQKTFVAGDVLTASDVNTYLAGEGGQWTAWTPTLTQSATVTKTVTYARYARFGRLITFNALLSVTGTGTAGNDVTIGLPVTAATAVANCAIGHGQIYDGSANLIYYGILIATSTTVCKIVGDSGAGAVSGSFYLGTSTFTAALANTDSITIVGSYEAATG